MDAVTAIGLGFKGPSYHDLRVNLLSDCRKECQLVVDSCRSNWKKYRCTIMADDIDFVKSIDASDVVKTKEALCNMFCEVIEWVGPSNVVHFVIDSAANYQASGGDVHAKYPNIFWSPSVAYCVNLILKDIGDMPHVINLLSKTAKVISFFYNHMVFLFWLRKREGWKDVVRPTATRFATSFISLKSSQYHKKDFQALAVDKQFTNDKLARSVKGKEVCSIVLNNKFWNDCLIMVEIMSPLIRLLRIVDVDKKPSMGYVYEGMQQLKEAIEKMFNHRRHLYQPYTEIITSGWNRHLKCDLYAAAYYLNPVFFCDEKHDKVMEKSRVTDAIFSLLSYQRNCKDIITVVKEMLAYKNREGSFGKHDAHIVAKNIQPDQWWQYFGGSAPSLKRMQERKRSYDPIDYECIDKVDFWIVEEESPEFEEDEDLELANNIYQSSAIPVDDDCSRQNEDDEVMGQSIMGSHDGAGEGTSGNASDVRVMEDLAFDVDLFEFYD